MIRIVCTGPESTGKTTLANQLGEKLACPVVPEFAREYLSSLGRPYQEADLLQIALGQMAAEDRLAAHSNLLVCDTDLLTIRIWSLYKYGRCDEWINTQISQRHYDAYLLCRPDIPWQFDPLRENPGDRAELYDIYKSELIRLKNNFCEIEGTEKQRLQTALQFVELINR